MTRIVGFGMAEAAAHQARVKGSIPPAQVNRLDGAPVAAVRTETGTIELILPLPPTANHYIKHARGQHYMTAEGKAFRAAVQVACFADASPRLTGRLSLSIVIHPADRRRMDLDNRIKPLQDALQHAGCFADDECIDRIEIERGAIVKRGRCDVVLRVIA